jgi:ribosomal protein S18 acetylase RimI-like enzyme
MRTQPIIRQAYSGELDASEQLVKEAYQEFRPLFPPDIWQAWLENLGTTIHSGEGILLVAEFEGNLEGAVKFFPDAAQAGLGRWPPGAASMRTLAVRPSSRNRGYGRLLVQECLRRARELGISTIYLYTGRFMQAARDLYEMMGFTRAPEFDQDPGPIAYRLDLQKDDGPG